MTDKVQKIREEVVKLKSQLLRGACSSQTAMETRCKEEAYDEVLTLLDSMQEEHDRIVDQCIYGKEPELVDVDDLPVVVDAPSEDYVKGFADGRLYEQRQKSETSVWHDANEEQPEEYRTVVVWNPSTMDGGVLTRCVEVYKGRIWAYIDDILNLSNVQRTVKNLEEPASKDKFTFTSLPRLLDRIKPTDRAKWYSSRLADALEKEGYITDAKIVRESIKLMNGEKVPMATMDEEPVSEDLNTELDKYIKEHFTIDKEQLDRFGLEEKDYMYSMDKSDMLILIHHFANWQKEKDNLSVSKDMETASKEWLRPQLDKSYEPYGENKMMELTKFDGYSMMDAIEFGTNWQKEQMMAKAIDGVVTFDYYDSGDKTYGCIAHDSFCLEDFGLKDTDKVKVIVIKED